MPNPFSGISFDSDLQLLALIASAVTFLAGGSYVFWRVGRRRGRKWRLFDDSPAKTASQHEVSWKILNRLGVTGRRGA
jgi:hypothetical protein